MTILSTIQDASMFISLERPATVFSATAAERELLELQALANTCGGYIAKDYEWQALKLEAVFTGNGSATNFPFPDGYDRMLKKAELWSTRMTNPLTHIVETDRWLEIDVRQIGFVTGAWSIFGDAVNIKPALLTGEQVKYYYMSNKWAKDKDGIARTSFAQDTDTFRLSEELLKLCIIWKWKAMKKLPYAQEQQDYEDAKEKSITADKGARILRGGRARMPRDVNIAYPTSIVP